MSFLPPAVHSAPADAPGAPGSGRIGGPRDAVLRTGPDTVRSSAGGVRGASGRRWSLFLPGLLFLLFGSACSVLDANWYAVSDLGQTEKDAEGNRWITVRAGELSHSFYSRSGQYGVLRGPCLFPIIDSEPPILNQQYIHLTWRIDGPPQAFPLRIKKEELQLESDGDSFPASVYQCDVSDEFLESRIYDSEELILLRPGCLSLAIYGLYYGKVTAVRFRPPVYSGHRPLEAPTMVFRFKREYEYTPWELPFAFAPVR